MDFARPDGAGVRYDHAGHDRMQRLRPEQPRSSIHLSDEGTLRRCAGQTRQLPQVRHEAGGEEMRRLRPRPLLQSHGWLGAFAVLVLANFALTASVQTPRLLDATYLDALRAEVRTNHPSVAAAQARVLAAEAGVRAVRLWEDPMAGIGVMAAERDMRADDGDVMFMAEQVLPRRKLYEARKARAAAERSLMEAEIRSAVLTLETLVAQTALELALVDE